MKQPRYREDERGWEPKREARVTAAGVRRVAAKYLDPGTFCSVMVGH